MKNFFVKLFIFFGFTVLFSCGEMPSGPNIPEIKKLGVFCALNPSMPSQTIYIGHTLTYQQVINKIDIDTQVDDVDINLSGQNESFNIVKFPKSNEEAEQNLCSTAGFISGTSGFNFIAMDQYVKNGQTYSLTVESEEFGELEAETTVPGDFEITHINIDPNLVKDSFYRYENAPSAVNVEWTESENAAGYLINLDIMVYQIPNFLQHNKFLLSLPMLWPEETFFDLSYSVEPADFAQKFDYAYQRGFLTKKNNIAISRELFLEMIKFVDDYNYRREYVKRVLFSVHAVDKAFYNYLALQFSKHANEQMIGQEHVVPDISNVNNGVGVFGSYVSKSKECRQIEFILQNYHDYNEENIHSRNKNEFYEQIGIDLIKDENPGLVLSPVDNVELLPGEGIELSWNSIKDEYEWYVLVLKPRYLWFSPGTMAYYVNGKSYKFSGEDFPFRDCMVEWYVKALLPNYNYRANKMSMALSPHKTLQVADNMDFSAWSESAYFTISSGKLESFENNTIQFLSLNTEQIVPMDCTLEWTQVEKADGYLVLICDSNNNLSILFSKDHQIIPSDTQKPNFIDGIEWCSGFKSGLKYRCKVCAVRVKSGALGFRVETDENGEISLSPRFSHPSGIIQKSQWSEELNLVVM